MTRFYTAFFVPAGLSLGLMAATLAPTFAQEAGAAPTEEDAPIGMLGARLGFSTTNGPVAGISLRANKIGEREAILLFSAEASRNDRNLSFSLGLPPSAPEKGSFGVDVYRNETKTTQVFGFETLSFGVNPYWTKALSDSSTITLGVDASSDSISNLAPNASALIAVDAGQRNRTALDFDYDYATDNFVATVSSGFIDRSTGGRNFRLEGKVTNSWTEPDAPVFFVTTLSFGNLTSLSGRSHIGDRFVLGQGLVRGFEYGGFGPRDLAAGNATLGGNSYAGVKVDAYLPNLVPDQENLLLGAFFDAGSLWGLDNLAGGVAGQNTVDDANYLRSSIGVGAKYQLGLGSVNLFLSQPLSKQSYDRESNVQLSIDANF